MKFTFMHMTQFLSERVKQQIIREHGETGQELTFLLEKDYIKTLWNRLSKDEQAVVAFFLKEKGQDFLTFREIEQGMGFSLSPSAFRVALTRLRRLGIIFTLRRLWGELAYVMPRELMSSLRQCLVPAGDWSRPISHPVRTSYHILEDLFQALNYVRKKPIGLTKKGTVHKKDLKAMMEAAGWNKNRLSSLVSKQPILHPYDKDEAILLDLLSKWGLLIQKGNRMTVGDMSLWIGQSYGQLRMACCDLIHEYIDMTPRLEFFWDIVQTLEAGKTYSLQSILESMGEFAPDFREVKEKLLHVHDSLGFIDQMEQDGDILWRWKELEQLAVPAAYIQPTFEIWIPSFSPWQLKWELLSFSRLMKREEMWSLKMDKETVHDFFESGKTKEELLSILRSCSASPIPDNVMGALEEWERDFRQITVMDARILLVRNKDVAAELEKIPSIASAFQQRLGEQAFIVRMRDWENLRDELEKRGYAPGAVIEQKGDEAAEIHGQPMQVYKQQTPGLEYKVESVFPDLEDAIPGVRQIPRMWVSNFSKYHESTLRELIQKASQMGMELRLEWQGSDIRLVPQALQNRNGFWILEGQENGKTSAYRLDDIGKIQILLPM